MPNAAKAEDYYWYADDHTKFSSYAEGCDYIEKFNQIVVEKITAGCAAYNGQTSPPFVVNAQPGIPEVPYQAGFESQYSNVTVFNSGCINNSLPLPQNAGTMHVDQATGIADWYNCSTPGHQFISVYPGSLILNIGARITTFLRAGSGCTPPKVLNKTTGSCELPSDGLKNPPCAGCCTSSGSGGGGSGGPEGTPSTVGNPVNFLTGNKIEHETDAVSVGDTPLTFSRFHNGLGVYALKQYLYGNTQHHLVQAPPFGLSWHHNYSQTLQVYSQFVKYVLANGQAFHFYQTATGGWEPDADVNYQLTETIVSNARQGWTVITPEGNSEAYNPNGDLLSITYRNGQSHTLSYSDGSTPQSVAPYPGLLVKVTDSYGRSLDISYNNDGRITSVNTPGGQVTHYGYDANRNLGTVTYADDTPNDPNDNPKKTYLYGEAANIPTGTNLPHALTGIIDENGVRYGNYRYDANGKGISTEHANGGINQYSLAYSNDDTATTVTDPLGTARTSHFTTVLGVMKVTGTDKPGGSGCNASSNAITYDANGNVASRTDFKGNRTNYTYDLSRNLETSRTEGLASSGATTPQTRTISTEWHASFRLPVKITEPGKETSYSYDSHGNLVAKTLKDTATNATRSWAWTYTYDSTVPGALLQKVENGPRTDVADITTTDYYPPTASCVGGHFGCRGQTSQVTDAMGAATQITAYNANGQPTSITSPNGTVTTLAYDARQRLTSRSWGNETTQYDYDNAGQLIKITQPDGSYLNYSYDAAHRLVQIENQLGDKQHFTLDNMGNRTQVDTLYPWGGVAQTQRYEYDALNRLAKSISGANQNTLYQYDSMDNLTDATDPLNHSTSYQYDSLNRLVQTLDAAGGTSNQSHDGRDNTTAVSNPKNNSTQYTYDGLDNLTQETSPDRGITQYGYDSAGNRISRTDARGKTVSYSYDALNRMTLASYGNPPSAGIAIHYSYDSLGHLAQTSDPYGTTTWSYDSKGRVTSRIFSSGALSLTVGYQYNAQGQVIGITYPSGKTVWVDHAWDLLNGLSVNGTALLQTPYYHSFGKPYYWVYGNGTEHDRFYNLDGNLYSLWYGNYTRDIAYDAAGRIQAFMNSDTPVYQEFTYDTVDRLTGHTDYAGTAFTITYDANGNRNQYQPYDANAINYQIDANSNRLLSTSQTGGSTNTYGTDAAGNVLGNGTTSFSYDERGRLVKAVGPFGTETYRINGLGQRTAKATGTGTGQTPEPGTYFAYDEAGHILGEYSQTGTAIQETVWMGDTPVAILQGTSNYYIYPDQQNTPRAIADQTGKIIWRWTDPTFGTKQPNPDPDGDGVQFTYNQRYPGQYYDASTGLHYNWHRSYDPATGRYLESDPIGLEGGLNTYGYVNGNPVNLIDPTGEVAGILVRIAITELGHAWVNAATTILGGTIVYNNIIGGSATTPAPYSKDDEHWALDLKPDPFGDNCDEMKKALEILKAMKDYRISDLNPISSSYFTHKWWIDNKLIPQINNLERAIRDICGEKCK